MNLNFRFFWCLVCGGAGPFFLGGCTTVNYGLNDIGTNVAVLQQAVGANHKAVIAVMNRLNAEDQPYRMKDGVTLPAFAKRDLTTLAPEDIAAWDKVLDGLDAYCAALVKLSSGTPSTDFVSSAEGLGCNINALARAKNLTPGSYVADAEAAITAIGGLVMKHEANVDILKVTQEADPRFQELIQDLLSTLGYAGNPPAAVNHGMLASYQAHYLAYNAPQIKAYRNDAIAGFDAMSPEEKAQHIQEFKGWLAVEEDHDEFVASVETLVTALTKAAAAHHAISVGTKPSLQAAFKDIQAEIKNAQAIYQTFTKG
jgi:hypothetical protein